LCFAAAARVRDRAELASGMAPVSWRECPVTAHLGAFAVGRGRARDDRFPKTANVPSPRRATRPAGLSGPISRRVLDQYRRRDPRCRVERAQLCRGKDLDLPPANTQGRFQRPPARSGPQSSAHILRRLVPHFES
jgi:hypothetical protein